MSKENLFSFWSPIKGTCKNWKLLSYLVLIFSIVEFLVTLFMSSNNTIFIVSGIIIYLFYLFLTIIFSGIKTTYINALIHKKRLVSLHTVNYSIVDIVYRGLLYMIIFFVWNIIVGSIFIGSLVILILLAFLFKAILSGILLTIGKGIFVIALLSLVFFVFGGYAYISYMVSAYYSMKFNIVDGFRFKEIIKRTLNKEYFKVFLKSIGMFAILSSIFGIFLIVLFGTSFIGSLHAYSPNETYAIFKNLLNPLYLHQNNILNIFGKYIFILCMEAIFVFYSFIFAYYPFEGYIRTQNKRNRR